MIKSREARNSVVWIEFFQYYGTIVGNISMNNEPLTFTERLRQSLWSFVIYPVFPWFERSFNFLHEKHRQPFHLGWIAPGRTIEDLKEHLSTEWGFGNHFVGWTDSGQVLSWRKLTSFREQYHIRVFEDGEIRGHYELTPEAAPIRHFRSVGQSARTENFMSFLGPLITTTENISVIKPQTTYEQISFAPSSIPQTVTYRTPKIVAFFLEKARLPFLR